MISLLKKWFKKMKKTDRVALNESAPKEIKMNNNLEANDVVNSLIQHREVLTNKILADLISNTSINKNTQEEKNKVKYVVESTVSMYFNDMISNFKNKMK
jgi:hypothetical protein